MPICVCHHPDKAHVEGKDACDVDNCDCHKFRDPNAPQIPLIDHSLESLPPTAIRTEFTTIQCQHKEPHTFRVTIPRKDEDFLEFFKKVEKIHAIVLTPDQCDMFRMGGTVKAEE